MRQVYVILNEERDQEGILKLKCEFYFYRGEERWSSVHNPPKQTILAARVCAPVFTRYEGFDLSTEYVASKR